MTQKILLVEPDFPKEKKSRNHNQSIPLGLLKLASYHRSINDEIELVHGNVEASFVPDRILITSLFTYWSKYVWDSVSFYKQKYPSAYVSVGGIYASLMPDHCKQSGCDEVYIGVHKEADSFPPAYDLVNADYQIMHTSRGCIRTCNFCGVWRIEPSFEYKTTIKDEVVTNRLLFFDNNLLANPNIEDILDELSVLRVNKRIVFCESQCGIDGRLLNSNLAKKLKKAHFQYPRIAWDHSFNEFQEIKNQIDILAEAGYRYRDIYIFMIYNFEHVYEEMIKKVNACKEWGVQIADCRYRPLDQTYDNYNPLAYKKGQTNEDYYIHPNWTDQQIRCFRKHVREQNIIIRHGFSDYSREKELAGRKTK